jgi:alkane 1-monooxygenase
MLRYSGPFFILASIPLLYYVVGPIAPLAAIAILLAALIGAEFLSGRGHLQETTGGQNGYRLLPHAYIPLQLGVTVWAIAVTARTSNLAVVCLGLPVGVAAGVFGVLAAHEMIHSRRRGERLLGTAMLTGMAYRHFRIAHVYGHHRWAGTERDAATARLGESCYGFLRRTLAGQLREAYEIENRRCRLRGCTALSNRVIQDVVVTSLLLSAIGLFVGVTGLLFFITQSVVAVLVLEMFNYVAHYGLVRHKAEDGRFERLDDRHSWNSSNVAANLLIFNMGRHAYHHRKPAASYEKLQFVRSAPELPAGYAASILLALIPPLWRRVMDPKVQGSDRSQRANSRFVGAG